MSLSYYIILGVIVLAAARLGYVNYHLYSRYRTEREEKKLYKKLVKVNKLGIKSLPCSNAMYFQLNDRYVVCMVGIVIREFNFNPEDLDDKAYMRVCAEELVDCLNRKP